jgi:hypothetical protein
MSSRLDAASEDAKLNVKELRDVLEAEGVDYSDCTEKAGLLRKLTAARKRKTLDAAVEVATEASAEKSAPTDKVRQQRKKPTKLPHQTQKEALEKKLKNQRAWFMRRVVILGILLCYCVGTIQMSMPGGLVAVFSKGAEMNDQGTMVVSLVIIILALAFYITCRSFVKASRDWADYQAKMRSYAKEARDIKLAFMREKHAKSAKEEKEGSGGKGGENKDD